MPLPLALPPGKTVRNIGGTNFLVSKTRRRRFKLPAKTRRKIAANARKMKIPVLTLAALSPSIFGVTDAFRGRSFQDGMNLAGRRLLQNFAGVSVANDGTAKFTPATAMKGLLPLGILTFVKRFGVFKGANQALAKSRLPVRLS